MITARTIVTLCLCIFNTAACNVELKLKWFKEFQTITLELKDGLTIIVDTLQPHLRLWDNGTVLWGALVQSGQGCGQDEGIGPDQAGKVAAGDVVFFPFHHHCVHHMENIPGQPYGAVQGGERSTLIAQCQRSTAIGQEVKPLHSIMRTTTVTDRTNCIIGNADYSTFKQWLLFYLYLFLPAKHQQMFFTCISGISGMFFLCFFLF